MNLNPLYNAAQKYIHSAQHDLLQWLSTPESYYQALLLLISFALAYSLAGLLRKRITLLQEPIHHSNFSWRWFAGRLGRLIYPLLVIGIMSTVTQLSREVFGEAVLLDAAIRVVKVWILWVLLRALVLNPLIRTMALWILVPAALLRLFNLLDDAIAWLEKIGFSIGDVHITAYILIKGIFLISIVIWLGKVISHYTANYIMSSQNLTRSTKELLIKLFDIILYAALFMITLNMVGIDLTALTVFSGALGVGLGFGLQKVASNFISGIILLSEKSININNLIEMDDGILGYVRKLGARASVVETFDGKEVMIPNEDFITSRVANLTHSNSKGRVDVPVGVSYSSDLDLVYRLIEEAAYEYEPTEKDRQEYLPQVYLREFGDNSVNYLLTFWLPDVTTGRWRAQSDVMLMIWRKFKEHNIEIPFPQRDLHIRSAIPFSLDKETEEKKDD